ncbi:phenylalanine--tRNA ligase subunit beta [candidate division Kazan bacterium RBG_13_50_9]|uniref:Phenylalanine--tRNA ligase beta subunit n=1 Tax=candidate division Kazan bacterium RBG_13_50_9 TaxID=1798535 RepID=A0A1F4NT57_UNCK3|nr:MAG: phenylalanine--tRNA ligase subunit beta [candidate division Kazan bacterium RBG_13_50_9]
MKFSYSWLKELVDFHESPEELADLINLHITEVESVTAQAGTYNGVIVAEVLEIRAHPNADKLKLVMLDVGLGKRVEVICGATNVEVGQKVPLAMSGAKLLGGMVKKAMIRGVESDGMICSGQELGIEARSGGILVLPKTASVGRAVNEALDASSDAVLDLKILSNRPDYLSYVGIAREIAAVLDKAWSIPMPMKFREEPKLTTAQQIKIQVKDAQRCPFYMARWVGHIEVEESPRWVKDKLASSGIRPINNLVDISNLVMLELGQPVHIFDADKIQGQKIVVRQAEPNEGFLALDSQLRQLTPEVLVIADESSPIALAGIMGGERSAVSDLTKTVVIEVATFDPATIRRGSKSIGLATDASLRFERGLSPYLARLAMNRAAALIEELLPRAQIARGAVEVGSKPAKPPTIACSSQEIAGTLGDKVTAAQIKAILGRLDFTVRALGRQLKIVPPPFRQDIKEAADIAEEVVRLKGIDTIKPAMPVVAMQPPAVNNEAREIDLLKDVLVRYGFSETPSHCFIGQAWADAVGLKLDDELKLINPLHSHWTHLTSQLWPNLLKFAVGATVPLKIFEINTVFAPPAGKEVLPKETKSLAWLITGQDAYLLARGIAEDIVAGVPAVKFVPVPGSATDKFINVLRILSKQHVVGSIEEVGPTAVEQLDVPAGTVWAEIDLSMLLNLRPERTSRFRPFSLFPSSQLDISVELPGSVAGGDLVADIEESSSLVKNVKVFDVYELAEGRRSLGLRVTLQSDERTLKEGEIKTTESKITNLLTTKYRGKIRGSGSK